MGYTCDYCGATIPREVVIERRKYGRRLPKWITCNQEHDVLYRMQIGFYSQIGSRKKPGIALSNHEHPRRGRRRGIDTP